MILLVALRLSIGWHFFYEGVWKINNADSFSALPFLTMAKGPFAPIFYSMAPDLDGKVRLKAEGRDIEYFTKDVTKLDVVDPAKDPAKALAEAKAAADAPEATEEAKQAFEAAKKALEEAKTQLVSLDFQLELVPAKATLAVYPAYYDQAKKLYDAALAQYNPEGEQLKAFQLAWGNYVVNSTNAVADDAVAVQEYLTALERFEAARAASNNGPEQKKRQWADMMKLRKEAKGFLDVQDKTAENLRVELTAALTPEQRAQGGVPDFVVGTDLLPFGMGLPFVGKSWTNFLNFAVTWALTLIGLCLILGFCTRIAAVGGGCFLIMILMTQPPWPTLFPAAHPETGHALIVDKNFVEMVAIFALALLPVGSWAGLDYFVWKWFGKPVLTKLGWIADDSEEVTQAA